MMLGTGVRRYSAKGYHKGSMKGTDDNRGPEISWLNTGQHMNDGAAIGRISLELLTAGREETFRFSRGKSRKE